MPITKDMNAGDVVEDFVHSKNKMFDKDSKKKRIERGLAAYYRKQREKAAVQIAQVPGGSKSQSPAKLPEGDDHRLSDGSDQDDANSGTGASPSPVVARMVRMLHAETAAVTHWESMGVEERRVYRMATRNSR